MGAIELNNKSILDVYISVERNMFVVEKFLNSLVKDYGKHTLPTDGGTWYPYACRLLKVKHHLHSTLRKALSKEQSNTLRTERNALMITFHVEERSAD
jgi:putative transposase